MTTDTETLEPEPDTAQADQAETDAVEQQADDDPVEIAERVETLPVRVEVAPMPRSDELAGLAQMAVTLAQANVVPASLRKKPHDVFAVLLTGHELGVAAMTAVRNFHVIEGQVTIPPKWKLAAVRSSGLGKVYPHEGPMDVPCPRLSNRAHGDDCPMCHGTSIVERVCPCGSREPGNDDQRAVWHGERHDTPGIIFTSGFTMQEAENAELADKKNWEHYPARMLSHRAAGYLLDDAFSEVATGMYSPDELGAVTDAEGNVIEVGSVESLIPSRPKAESPPIQPDVLADFKRRIERLTPEAKAGLLAAYRARGELPKLDELRHNQQTIVDALIVAAEQVSRAAVKDAEREQPGSPETPVDSSEPSSTAADGVTQPDVVSEAPGEPLPFDPAGLPEGRTPADDVAWADAAPDEWIAEAIDDVRAVPLDEVKMRVKAFGHAARGNDDTLRATLTAAVVRRRMERAIQ